MINTHAVAEQRVAMQVLLQEGHGQWEKVEQKSQ